MPSSPAPVRQPGAPRSLQYYMRAIHRILGYLAVGMAIVFSLSGITLVYRTGNFMKHATRVETVLAPGLDARALGDELKIKGFKATEETPLSISFADGIYDKTSGRVDYVKREVVPPFDRFISLHKVSAAKSTHLAVALTVFGAILFFLAVTALFMYKPSARSFPANMIITVIGVILTIILLLAV